MPELPVNDSARKTDNGPNPDVMKSAKDPMADFFGPGTGTRLIGDNDEQVPDQVLTLLSQYGLSKKSFTCGLYEVPEGVEVESDNTSNCRYITGFHRSVPTLDWLSREHGPGRYMLLFTWYKKDVESGKENIPMRDSIVLEVSEKAIEEHKRHRFKRTLEEARNKSTRTREALTESKMENRLLEGLIGEGDRETKTPAESAKEYITSAMETVKMLGVPVGMQQPQPPAKVVEWDKVLPALAPLVLGWLQHQRDTERARQEDFNKLLMLMVTQGQNANTQLVEMFSRMQSGSGVAKEYIDMIKNVVDLKELVTPQQETLSDKVFRLIEGVAPHIMSIAATAASTQAAKSNPLVGMAKGYIDKNPDFQALKENPDEMKKTVTRMDDFFGWEQTDMIMNVMGWARPDYCPRDPAKKEPPKMDQETEKEEGAPGEE